MSPKNNFQKCLQMKEESWKLETVRSNSSQWDSRICISHEKCVFLSHFFFNTSPGKLGLEVNTNTYILNGEIIFSTELLNSSTSKSDSYTWMLLQHLNHFTGFLQVSYKKDWNFYFSRDDSALRLETAMSGSLDIYCIYFFRYLSPTLLILRRQCCLFSRNLSRLWKLSWFDSFLHGTDWISDHWFFSS